MATFGVKVVVTRFGVSGLFGIEVWQLGLGVYWVWGTLTQPKTPDIIDLNATAQTVCIVCEAICSNCRPTENITLLLEVRGAAPDRM